MNTSWQCPRCGHRNSADIEACGKCKFAKVAPETVNEIEYAQLPVSATPWIIGAVTFSLIFVIGVLCRHDENPSISSVFAAVNMGEEPPETFNSGLDSVSGRVSSPQHPGQVQKQKGEWHSVSIFQGTGHQRTQTFSIRALHWRMQWATVPNPQVNEPREWYGPGSDFKALVFRAPKEEIAEVASRYKQNASVVRLRGNGTYYADVSSPHNWVVKVEEWW